MRTTYPDGVPSLKLDQVVISANVISAIGCQEGASMLGAQTHSERGVKPLRCETVMYFYRPPTAAGAFSYFFQDLHGEFS